MKTYLSGPLAGLPELTREEKVARFKRAAEIIEHRMGLDPLDPNDVLAGCGVEYPACGGDTNGHTWECWLRYDMIAMLMHCDAIALLPGWESSKGATLELHVAKALGWKVIDLSQDVYVRTGELF